MLRHSSLQSLLIPSLLSRDMKKYFPYLSLVVALAATVGAAKIVPILFPLFAASSDAALLTAFFSISVICLLSFVIYHLAQKTIFPSFVVAIFFGIAAQPLLTHITEERELLGVIVGIGATLILFGGGLETPFGSFKKLFVKIMTLSFVGLGITAMLFSYAVYGIGSVTGNTISLTVAVLLGAILASTDPAAIIPVLKRLRFNNRATKDLVISESAVTDVTGTLLTLAFLGIVSAGGVFTSIGQAYHTLMSQEVALVLLKEILFGILFGFLGFVLLNYLSKFTKTSGHESESHAAYFLFVPIIMFTLAAAFHGSGYLAAFVAGLLFVLAKHLHDTERYFNHTIEGFLKPTIFVLLGALVDIHSLISYAPVGILAALTFMFIIRPLSVFVALGPFSFFGKDRFTVRELLFISFVRETGAIPAVLLVTVVSLGVPGLEGLVPVGMWVILATLILEPPLTPVIANVLKVATPISDEHLLALHHGKHPFVILGSRGHSFMDRLPFVTDWAARHNIFRVVVLHCMEDKYSPEAERDIEEQAQILFRQINDKRTMKEETSMDFEYIARTGFLQDNINDVAQHDEHVTAIFVGRKVLDFRLEEVKKLCVPLYFID